MPHLSRFEVATKEGVPRKCPIRLSIVADQLQCERNISRVALPIVTDGALLLQGSENKSSRKSHDCGDILD